MEKETENYLKQGSQTEVTKKMIDISRSINGDGFDYVLRVLEWLNKNIKYPQPKDVDKNDVFRKRKAEDIVNDGYATGCTDFALVFVALSRAKKIPTKYVEVIDKAYFKGDLDKVSGHVFAECFIQNRWVGVDPMAGYIKYSTRYPKYVLYKKGLDSWDIDIFDLNSMRKKFKEFALKRDENG